MGGGEDTCSRRHRLPAPPCSWSRPICPSTSPSASPPTCGPTPAARPSPSACSTTGRSCPATPILATIWTNCNHNCFTLYCMLFVLDYKYFSEVGSFYTFHCWLLLLAKHLIQTRSYLFATQ